MSKEMKEEVLERAQKMGISRGEYIRRALKTIWEVSS